MVSDHWYYCCSICAPGLVLDHTQPCATPPSYTPCFYWFLTGLLTHHITELPPPTQPILPSNKWILTSSSPILPHGKEAVEHPSASFSRRQKTPWSNYLTKENWERHTHTTPRTSNTSGPIATKGNSATMQYFDIDILKHPGFTAYQQDKQW